MKAWRYRMTFLMDGCLFLVAKSIGKTVVEGVLHSVYRILPLCEQKTGTKWIFDRRLGISDGAGECGWFIQANTFCGKLKPSFFLPRLSFYEKLYSPISQGRAHILLFAGMTDASHELIVHCSTVDYGLGWCMGWLLLHDKNTNCCIRKQQSTTALGGNSNARVLRPTIKIPLTKSS